jgi:hypothetical protein
MMGGDLTLIAVSIQNDAGLPKVCPVVECRLRLVASQPESAQAGYCQVSYDSLQTSLMLR